MFRKSPISRSFAISLLLVLASLACLRIEVAPRPAPAAALPLPALPLAVTPQPTAISPVMPRPTAALIPTLPPLPTATRLPICLVSPLEEWQHLSATGSFTETESMASTRMMCHLERDSCGYNQLVGLVDASIVFKAEELPPFDTEDILMHPAMISPLARLNQLVQAEWGGAYQLRVTDAYDSLLEHDPPESEPSGRYSLHYEGRAIDLTLWPVDYSQYGRLCALAHCAGFDWVHNEVTHCHASIKAESLCAQCD